MEMSSKECVVSRPFGGLGNLPSKELNMSKVFVVLALVAASMLLAFAAPAQQVAATGGNGGIVVLPGGGGFTQGAELGLQQLYTPGQPLNPWKFKMVSFHFNAEGEAVVLGFYESSLIQAIVDGVNLEYQATLQATATPPGTKFVTRYVCRCCNREQEVTTDCGGSSNYQFYSDEHDKAVKVRLKNHPEKKADPVPQTH